jgi:signal transduction histidine kinase/DNA-binding response OmpR family regulator
MKWLSQIQFENKLPDGLKPRFFYELNVRNVQRIKIVAWLGIIVFSLLLIIDYLRIQSGLYETSWVYAALLWNHLIGVFLFIIPILLIKKRSKSIQSGQYDPGPIMNVMLLVLIFALIGQTIFTYIERENLVLFTIFILGSNWAITMDHFERIWFNVISAIFMICAILMLGAHSTVAQLIHIFEIVGFTFLAFVFNTFDFNLRWGGFLKEVELAREKRRIESLEAVKANLYTNLTHEFRTPLTVIRGMSDMAKTYVKQKKTSELLRSLELIDTHSDNILNLINQLLNLSQLESSLMTLHPQQKDVVKFSRMAVGLLEATALKRHINVEHQADRDVFLMDFDEEKLQSVITNLISNAIKFNYDGGEVHCVLKVIENPSEQLEIKIWDTGYGIGKEHLPYIFDRFYQADTGPTRKTTGTGIGLALTKELVELMGGKIDVSSTLGQGTEFTIHLPVTHNAEVSEIAMLDKSGKHQGNNAARTFSSSGAKPWLLIVEDNTDVRNYLAELLEEEYLIELAIDGIEGEQKAKDLIPDLIISDIMMPGQSGYSLCRELKQHEKTNHIPILLLTAKATTKDRMDSWSRGADAYMTKPFEAAELKLRLSKLHEIRSTLREKYQKMALVNDSQALRKESVFLHDLNAYIDAHLQDRNFSIEGMAKALFMSRMQLHRKLKAMTGRSASNYVRVYKLYKARPLLPDTSRTIADIAYDVGFEDPGYFTKAYQNEFGETPSKFRQATKE